MDNKSYLYFNISIASIIILVFIYAGFFVDNTVAIACLHKKITGVACATCGLTRGFNLLLHGELASALKQNELSLKIFFFFVGQLLIRLLLIFLGRTKNVTHFIKHDAATTLMLFGFCFYELICQLYIL